jgi:hypothetical protein
VDALSLTNEINGVDFWSDAEKLQLCDVVTTKLMAGVTGKRGGNRVGETLQECRIDNYLSVSLVKKLMGPAASRDGRINMMSHHAKKLCITHPTEATFGRMVAIVAISMQEPTMAVPRLHDILVELKRVHRHSCASFAYPHGFLKSYPDDPAELPQDMLDYAFLAGDGPENASIGPQVDHICAQKFLRKSGTGVSRASAAGYGAPMELNLARKPAPMDPMQNPMQMMMAGMAQMFQTMGHGPGAMGAGIGLKLSEYEPL